MKIEFDAVKREAIINGVKYVPETVTTFKCGEAVIIKEVRAEYRLGSTWLCLSFEMPKTKFNPGDRIRIIREA